ncbi:ankyrin repeat-containing domain protein [Rhexocercosporidium sp. MPI-PUGE-AT-0058]|nr:ankyrin repeat-containing domain protein [Rhexocercosporidium sp. MPI-PUGE-AT-0058]
MEALAAASSVLAVVSVAVQLTSSIQKLISFWDSVVDAPAEVLEITTHLRVLCALLRAIEIDSVQDRTEDGSDASLATDCLGICGSSIEKLEMLTRELDVGLQKRGVRRKWMCLKKAIREKKVQSYWAEMERAKSMLLLYQGLRNGQRCDSTLQLFTNFTQLIPQRAVPGFGTPSTHSHTLGYHDSSSRLIRKPIWSCDYKLRLSFATIRVKFLAHAMSENSHGKAKRMLARKQKQYTLVASFSPNICHGPVMEWTFKHSYNSIGFGLRTFNPRPIWSPIFESAAYGDIEKVRELILEGKASPYDVDPNGWTALHYAATTHHTELCKMLIRFGAATNCVTVLQQTPLLLATAIEHLSSRNERNRSENEPSSSLNTVRLLVEEGGNDPMDIDDIGFTSIFDAAGNISNDALAWLLTQGKYSLDLEYVTPTGHTVAAYISSRNDLSPSLLRPLLRAGIALNGPCAKEWYFRYRRDKSNWRRIEGDVLPTEYRQCLKKFSEYFQGLQ